MDTLFNLLRHYKELSLVILVGLISGVFVLFGLAFVAQWLISLTSLVIAVQLGIGMIKTLRNGQYGIDILAITAIVSTVAVGQYWATLVITLMLVGGEALEAFANMRAKAELTELMKRAPKIAHLVSSHGTITDVDIDSVVTHDVLSVKPGEIIPVDGIIKDGHGSIDESSLTGESLPVDKKPGDTVLSGAVNGNETLTIIASSDASASQYAQIVALVQAAADSRAPFVRLADRYAVPFTLIAFIIGIIAWVLSGDPIRFAEVLVVATPCPLLIAAPVALISGMSRAAKQGIIMKSGAVIEQLARIQSIVFDKTGTLTSGSLSVHDIMPSKGMDARELIRITASIEQASPHVIADVIVKYATSKHIALSHPSSSNEVAGNGIHGVLHGDNIHVGNRDYILKHSLKTDVIPLADRTTVYIARNGSYIGSISFVDTIRANSKATLRRLRALQIDNISMLTGDNKQTALLVGKELGITHIQAECLPVDKLSFIQKLSRHPIMMVGDGVNDAPVLSAADVGIAMGARGATAASESADAVILFDDISKVVDAIEISRHTIRVALQSVFIGIIISIGLMVVAATGRIPAIVGAGLQELVDVIVILNALRAHGSFQK